MTDDNANVTETVAQPVAETAPAVPVAAQQDISAGDKLLGILAYVSFFCILPLVLRPNSEFCQVHGKQGLVITLAFLFFSWMAWVSSLAEYFLIFLHIAVALVGILQAARGVTFKFPGLYEVVKQINLKN